MAIHAIFRIALRPRRSSAKVIDTFAFGNAYEVEELLLRMYEMGEEVSEFHIVEGNRDFTGAKKPLRSEKYLTGYGVQEAQRKAMRSQMHSYDSYDQRDIFLEGDLDEIVSHKALKILKNCEPVTGGWNAHIRTHIRMGDFHYSMPIPVPLMSVSTRATLRRKTCRRHCSATQRRFVPKFLHLSDVQCFGEEHDGGYLHCLDSLRPSTLRAAYSMGVEQHDQWSLDVFKAFNIPIFQNDCAVSHPAQTCEKYQFFPTCLSSKCSSNLGKTSWTLKEAIEQSKTLDAPDRSLLMKMEIEFGEWPTLTDSDMATLKNFRQLVIEKEENHETYLQAMQALRHADASTATTSLQSMCRRNSCSPKSSR
eukprot:s6634_g1.t1